MTVTTNADRCRAWYYAHREQILAQRRAEQANVRLSRIERAVMLGGPIGRSLPVCGSTAAYVQHKSRGERCGQCSYTIASEQLARTWMDPRRKAAEAQARKARYYQANKESIRSRNDAWFAAHAAETREYRRLHAQRPEQRARRAAWRDQNRGRMAAYQRAHYDRVGIVAWRARGAAWRNANLERARAVHRAWKKANPEVGANDSALRRARLRGLPAEYIDRRLVWVRDEGVCHLCGTPADVANWHLDHVVPIARGGAHLYDNVRVSHPHCNQRKGARA